MESKVRDQSSLPPTPPELFGNSELELVRVTEAAALAAGPTSWKSWCDARMAKA